MSDSWEIPEKREDTAEELKNKAIMAKLKRGFLIFVLLMCMLFIIVPVIGTVWMSFNDYNNKSVMDGYGDYRIVTKDPVGFPWGTAIPEEMSYEEARDVLIALVDSGDIGVYTFTGSELANIENATSVAELLEAIDPSAWEVKWAEGVDLKALIEQNKRLDADLKAMEAFNESLEQTLDGMYEDEAESALEWLKDFDAGGENGT